MGWRNIDRGRGSKNLDRGRGKNKMDRGWMEEDRRGVKEVERGRKIEGVEGRR